ncbi:copper homeostasis CutC domain-containing protein [Mycena belliarum]|uniref:Copper homeostasis protein cutC homolog n=1 Tax=Mycena belliarum TaxID=1033014 RepID=A0AAD6UJ74_9AGAR|nr:copper homeostasis CutC domain-containing protein [Mycena belliae]
MSQLIPPILIEVCVDSVQSARNAVQGGANRLEVCGNLGAGGGTTPSLGLLKAIKNSVGPDVPMMAMIRPRMGDFLYSKDEVEVMLEDILLCKQHAVRGVVLGALKPDGRIDIDTTKRLVIAALPLEVCFHRAFDMTRDAEEALRDVMQIGGVSRILTSGHGALALESITTLESLCQATQRLAADLSILPGSGINSGTVGPILDALLPLGVKEIHLSGGSWIESEMIHRRDGLGMGIGEGEWGIWETSELKVRAVRQSAEDAQSRFSERSRDV